MGKRIIKKLIISLVTNPILIIIYWIFCYELDLLCKFGKINNNISIMLICVVAFMFLVIFSIIRIRKNIKYENTETIKRGYKIVWRYIAIISIVIITCFYGIRIFESGRNYNGRLAWFLDELKNKKSVKFEHNNIYKDGVEGIFKDINEKFNLPKKLYISNGFKLNFNSDGTILSFETFVYGKNDKGKEKTYLIYYDKKKSKDVIVEFRNVNSDYNVDKLLEPLIKTVKAIPMKDTINGWKSNEYGIVYYGKRSWGFNTDGIVNIDEKGNRKPVENSDSPIIGYTVSVFVPGKENEYIPVRYNLMCNADWSKSKAAPKENNNKENFVKSNKSNEEFYLSKQVYYKLEITGAAAGRRAYSLNSTNDQGKTWKIINADPFRGGMGVASGITFINNKIGFLGLSNNGGSTGELYRTEDGGISFEKVSIPVHKVKLDNGTDDMSCFDFPEMPCEENGKYNMLVGQGSDGNYNSGCSSLYQSEDNGKTWNFIKEVKKSSSK